MSSNVRNKHIDIMKGFAILLVILGHRFMTNTIEGAQHSMAIIIYSFHMAFFFFISGYVNAFTDQQKRKGVKKYLMDKTRTILLPFFAWTLICYLYDGGNTLDGLFPRLNFYPVTGYWFLPVLFTMFFITLICNKLHINWGGCFVVLSLIITGLLIKQVYPIWYAVYFIAFMFGEFMARENIERFFTRKLIYGVSALLLAACWIIYPIEGLGISKFINLGMMLLIGIVSCITFFNFFKVIKLHRYLEKYFTEIGKYTIVLYLVPVVILPPNTFKINPEFTFTTVNLIILSVAILHSLVSYVIGRVVYEIPYLRFILFGKK